MWSYTRQPVIPSCCVFLVHEDDTLPFHSGLHELFFQKLDLRLSPGDSQHRLLIQQGSWVFRQIMCGCGTETIAGLCGNWTRDSTQALRLMTAAPLRHRRVYYWLLSTLTLVWLLQEFWDVDRFSLYREENETPKNSHTGITPVVIGRTQDRNRNALIFLQDFCKVLNPDDSHSSGHPNENLVLHHRILQFSCHVYTWYPFLTEYSLIHWMSVCWVL